MEGFNAFLGRLQEQIIDPIITLIALAAFAVFAWGVAVFIMNADNAEKRSQGQRHMVWGIIGLVIIFGARVIATILKNIVGADVTF